MSGLGLQVAKWGPVLIKYLPQIIKVGHDIYALWCSIRNNKKQNDTVVKAMKLLNQHQDHIDRLLQDPQQKNALLEGLTILMNRINEHNQGEINPGKKISSYSLPSVKGDADADVCYSKSGYNTDLCSKNGCNGDSAESMTFEKQIEYALLLSQQEAESHGQLYVEQRWREVLEAEDEMIAMALQESEIYSASYRCAQQYSMDAKGCSPDEMKELEKDECAQWKCDKDCSKGDKEQWEGECTERKCDDEEWRKGEEDKKKTCALLKEEEDLLIQMAIRISLEQQEEANLLA